MEIRKNLYEQGDYMYNPTELRSMLEEAVRDIVHKPRRTETGDYQETEEDGMSIGVNTTKAKRGTII